uniref:Acetoin:2,6-dichlorophenolindophenol oxidoreductase subunit beta n=1 Tax=Lygus hesperus TaxID=30085 RepID=A0A0A9XUJ5_LYGHE
MRSVCSFNYFTDINQYDTILTAKPTTIKYDNQTYEAMVLESTTPLPTDQSPMINFVLKCNYNIVCGENNPDCFTNNSVRFYIYVAAYDKFHILDAKKATRHLPMFSPYVGAQFDINDIFR